MNLIDLAIMTMPHGVHASRQFNLGMVCVVDIYLRNLLPYKNDHIKKLNIFLVGVDKGDTEYFSKTTLTIGRFSNPLSIGEVFLKFDFDEYLKKDDYGKKLTILDKIQEGFMLFADTTNSETQPFKEAYQKSLNQGLIDEYLYKELASKNRLYKIRVYIRVDFEKLEVIGIFCDKEGGEISRKTFFAREPWIRFDYFLGKVVWSDDRKVTLYGRDKTEFWTIEMID